jgi:hypothetical protein
MSPGEEPEPVVYGDMVVLTIFMGALVPQWDTGSPRNPRIKKTMENPRLLRILVSLKIPGARTTFHLLRVLASMALLLRFPCITRLLKAKIPDVLIRHKPKSARLKPRPLKVHRDQGKALNRNVSQ